MDARRRRSITWIALIGAVIVLVIIVVGTIWMGYAAGRDTDRAVRAVSQLFLDELAGRREQVVENNLEDCVDTIHTAVELMTDEDLSDEAHREVYQARMKALYHLDRFAFVGESGVIYTASGPVDEIGSYSFDYLSMTEPDISIRVTEDGEKKVVIAVPIAHKPFEDDTLIVCFMEIDMDEMLEGVSMHSDEDSTTYCNIYTSEGYPLSSAVLGGFAEEDNLFAALVHAEFDSGYSLAQVEEDFSRGVRGEVSFNYNGRQEILTYVGVEGTDWLLTYLIRETLISERISEITSGTLIRGAVQLILTIAALFIMFAFIIRQTRRNARILAEKEVADAEARVKQEEMEQKLALQEELLAHKEQSEQQERMIHALSSDYRSVYYLELDRNVGVCYQERTDLSGLKVGEEFPYLEAVTAYCNQYVTEPYREDFLKFIQPDAIREGLKDDLVISFRYMISVNGKESWEAVKFAGVRHPDELDDHLVHTVGACFADVDTETRDALEQKQTLKEALEAAENANRAKTAFLSNMSHEIRTPMNAIIGLDSIALNEPDIPDTTRGYLEKIGNSAEHLMDIINDILDMSRIESGRLTIKNEEFSFSHLLEQVNTMISGQCQEKGLEFDCRINSRIADYYIGDDMKLRQVLINILGNAVKFTPAGGRIEFAVECTAHYAMQSVMSFRISDTGIGMDREFLPKIFEVFAQEDSSATNRYGSTGLGLAITKSIVEMMNGDIEVESEKGVGSTFTVTVPLTDVEHADSGEEEEIRPQEMNVLIVDDDPIACEHAKLVLESVGIDAEIVMSGIEAVEMVRLRHARRDPYNLILVDWKMPEIDGVETTRRIRAIVGNESAIIILTAYKWDDVLEEALNAGVDSFVAKPLFAANILEEFRAAFRKKSQYSGRKTKAADLEGRRVLLAEDVAVNAEIIIMILNMRNIEVEHAENGRIAVDMFLSHEAGYYDAILMDMRMPEMDGLTASSLIRSADHADAEEIPIIALTANAFDEDVQRSLQAGLNAHLSKPVQPENLFETLESLIGERESEREDL